MAIARRLITLASGLAAEVGIKPACAGLRREWWARRRSVLSVSDPRGQAAREPAGADRVPSCSPSSGRCAEMPPIAAIDGRARCRRLQLRLLLRWLIIRRLLRPLPSPVPAAAFPRISLKITPIRFFTDDQIKCVFLSEPQYLLRRSSPNFSPRYLGFTLNVQGLPSFPEDARRRRLRHRKLERLRDVRSRNARSQGGRICERAEKRFCRFEVVRVEPFGKPVVDRLEKCRRIGGSTQIVQQQGQARRGAQFPG